LSTYQSPGHIGIREAKFTVGGFIAQTTIPVSQSIVLPFCVETANSQCEAQ
jgi:hypothetical protein